jgi:hypothetical protein
MRRTSPLVAGLFALVGLLSAPAPASAKVLITSGDHIAHLGDLKVKPEKGPIVPGVRVGFKYNHFGIFWLNLWTWGGEYCLYKDREYVPISRAEAAAFMGVEEKDIGPPFTYSWPPGLLVLLGIVLLCVLGVYLERARLTPAQRLQRDSRYRQAVAMYREHAGEAAVPGHDYPEGVKRREVAYEAAVLYLVDQGISHNDAEENLALLGVPRPGSLEQPPLSPR